jgi:hypothetical protein
MVATGVRLEEGVREGRLINESVPAGSSKEKDQGVNMVKGQQVDPHRQAQKTPQYDPIPIKYAVLLPQLLERNLVQTKAPPPVPARLPAWYRPDLFCTFHQGAPGHDIEHCNALKKEVQNLIRTNRLTF